MLVAGSPTSHCGDATHHKGGSSQISEHELGSVIAKARLECEMQSKLLGTLAEEKTDYILRIEEIEDLLVKADHFML